MAYDVKQLLKMSQADLDKLFTESPPGPIPDGEAEGTAIVDPGTAARPSSPGSSTTSRGRERSSTRRTRRWSITLDRSG